VIDHAEFQSTPPRGGRLRGRVPARRGLGFQSTPPRGGRHRGPPTSQPVKVSIHAPARGATDLSGGSGAAARRFNPRPRAGGDRTPRAPTAPSIRFQSTPPRGGRRPGFGFRVTGPTTVSIHAPARGATTGHRPTPEDTVYSFNPRPRAGGDDDRRKSLGFNGDSFNPRPRAGGDDLRPVRSGRHGTVSIHAPARGATTTGNTVIWPSCDGFNPRPRAGGDDPSMSPSRTVGWTFQSTPPRGGRRPAGPQGIRTRRSVSIHAPARGATTC